MIIESIQLSANSPKMKTGIRHGWVFCLLLAAGCGGAAKEPITTPEPMPFPVEKAVVTPPPAPPKPPRQAPIQRVESYENTSENARKCRADDQEDGTQMVISNDSDWFLYVPSTAEVECGTFGGKVKIIDGPLSIRIEALIPRSSSGNIELELRKQATTFIKTEVSSKYGSRKPLVFEMVKLGRSKRPALCVDADLDISGLPGKIAACVTSKTNTNDEVVVHRAVWVGTSDQYDAKKTFVKVKNAAANWFRYSDTDGMGKIVNKW